MTESKKLFILVLFSALLLPAASNDRPLAARSSVRKPDCVTVTPVATYRGYGYSHTAKITNSCAFDVQCVLATDIDIQKITTRVKTKSEQTTVFRQGSPSREFNVTGQCSTAKMKKKRL